MHTNTNEGNALLRMLATLRTRRLYQFTGNSGDGVVDEGEDASVTNGANVVSSERVDSEHHAVLLDLDVPAYLVPSTTPGHSHLYIDVDVPEDDYFNLLDALAACGVIERGYAASSKAKGGTYLRLPWVKRDTERENAAFMDRLVERMPRFAEMVRARSANDLL